LARGLHSSFAAKELTDWSVGFQGIPPRVYYRSFFKIVKALFSEIVLTLNPLYIFDF